MMSPNQPPHLGSTHLVGAMLAIWLTACQGAPPPVDFSAHTTSAGQSYEDAYWQWTRTGKLRRVYDQVIVVHATLVSPAFDDARTKRRDALSQKPLASAETMAVEGSPEVQTKDPNATQDVVLIVSTHDRRENDLHRKNRASWKVALIDDEGNYYEPLSVIRDKRPREVIRAEYPAHGDFSQAYVASFPRQPSLFSAGRQHITVRVFSARGAIDLKWEQR